MFGLLAHLSAAQCAVRDIGLTTRGSIWTRPPPSPRGSGELENLRNRFGVGTLSVPGVPALRGSDSACVSAPYHPVRSNSRTVEPSAVLF